MKDSAQKSLNEPEEDSASSDIEVLKSRTEKTKQKLRERAKQSEFSGGDY